MRKPDKYNNASLRLDGKFVAVKYEVDEKGNRYSSDILPIVGWTLQHSVYGQPIAGCEALPVALVYDCTLPGVVEIPRGYEEYPVSEHVWQYLMSKCGWVDNAAYISAIDRIYPD